MGIFSSIRPLQYKDPSQRKRATKYFDTDKVEDSLHIVKKRPLQYKDPSQRKRATKYLDTDHEKVEDSLHIVKKRSSIPQSQPLVPDNITANQLPPGFADPGFPPTMPPNIHYLLTNHSANYKCDNYNWCELQGRPGDSCSCNSETCPLFGNCCRDTFQSTSVLLEKHLQKASICQVIQTSDTTMHLHVIFRCSNLSMGELVSKCNGEMNRSQMFDINAILPVYSANSYRVFKNIYCAKCYGEQENEIKPFNVVIYDSSNSTTENNCDAYDLEATYYSQECGIGFEPPKYSMMTTCIPEVKETCRYS